MLSVKSVKVHVKCRACRPCEMSVYIKGCILKISSWQEGLITDNVLKQLQGDPKVVIHPVGPSSSGNNDRNVPDLNNVANYLECETVSEYEDISANFEETVLKTNNVDIVEQNLGKMFGDDVGTCVAKPSTNPPPCNKNKPRKRKKNPEELRVLLRKLFGDPTSDEEEDNKKPKKIENKRRRTLPVSINLKPLKVIQKRKSETDAIRVNATNQAINKIHSPLVATILKEIEYTTLPLLKNEKDTEVANTSVSQSNDFDTMRNVIVVKPVVCEAETQKTVQTEMAEIVDLTLDDSEYPSIVESCTEKSVKEEEASSETAEAPSSRGASMPLLSPDLPADSTTQEANLPSETSMLRSFRISDKLFQNLNNQTEATQRPPPAPSQITSSKESAQNENNTHSFFANLQMLETKTRIPSSVSKKTCQQSQLQATLTSIRKAAEGQAKQVNPPKATLQKSISIQEVNKKQQETVSAKPNHQQQITISRQQQEEQQRIMPRQQQEANSFSQRQSALKRSLSLHDQMQDSNKRHHHLRQQQEKAAQQQRMQRSNSLQQQQQSNLVDPRLQRSLHLGEQQSHPVNLRQNPITNNHPPPQENLSLLHQLVQNTGPQPVSFSQGNFAASHQFPSQPPQMMRLFAATTESFQIISNTVCADILLLQLLAYIKWVHNVSIFRETVVGFMIDPIFKPSSLLIGKYFNQVILEFGNKIIRDLLPFDVERFDLQEIFNAVSKKLLENGHKFRNFGALSIISYLIKPCQAICTTPFTKKFYHHITTTSDNLEARSRLAQSRAQNVVIWDVVRLKLLETQIQQYHILSSRISNWLQANKSSSKDTHSYEKTPKKNSSLNQMLTHTTQHETNNTTTVPSTVPSIQVQSHIIIPPSGQDKPRQPSPPTVPSQQKPNLIQTPVVNVSIVPSTQKQSSTTRPENENLAQEISVYAEPLPSVQPPPREEPDTTTDDDVVDLTWIDDGDDDEIAEEIKDCKAFLFKVETDEEKISSPVREVRSVSPDSGCGSPHLPNDDPATGQSQQEYWCWCGNKAIFICRCQISMYCSSECQNKDWADHQNLCKRVQGKQ